MLCVLSVAYFLPIYWMVTSSIKVDRQLFTDPPTWIPRPPQWSNYRDVLNSFDFLLNLKNSLIITVPSVIGTVISRRSWPTVFHASIGGAGCAVRPDSGHHDDPAMGDTDPAFHLLQ